MSEETAAIDTTDQSIQDATIDSSAEDDAIGAIWDKHQSDGGEVDSVDVSPEAEKAESTSTGRDEKGRFAAKSDDAHPDADAVEDKPDANSDEETPEPKSEHGQASAAPAHLPYDIKSNWEGIPVAARDAITALTAEQDRKFGELGRELSTIKPIKETLDNYKEYFDGTKGNYKPEDAVNYLFSVQRKMDKDPMGTIMEIAHSYGVADRLVNPTDGTREIVQLEQTIRELQTRLDKQGDAGNIDERITRTLEERDFSKAIDEFAKTADHYAEVEEILPKYIQASWAIKGDQANRMDVLNHAYKMATNEIPEVRAKIEAAKQAKAAEKSDPKRTESAKRAASINVKSNGTGRATTYATDDEAYGAAYDRAMAS